MAVPLTYLEACLFALLAGVSHNSLQWSWSEQTEFAVLSCGERGTCHVNTILISWKSWKMKTIESKGDCGWKADMRSVWHMESCAVQLALYLAVFFLLITACRMLQGCF